MILIEAPPNNIFGGFLFSRASVLQTCDMFSKIYLAALGLSIAVMAFLTYYSWSWLQSIGQPAAAVAGYEYHSNLAWITLWITSVVLLLLGNAVLWTTRSAWAMWVSFLYFAVAIIALFFWLDRVFLDFVQTNTGVDTSVSTEPFIGAILIIAAAVMVFLNKFLVVRLLAKTYPESTKTASEAEADIE